MASTAFPRSDVNVEVSCTVSDVPSVSVPLTVSVESSSDKAFATAVPLTVTAYELLMTASFVESAPRPTASPPPSTNRPTVPVIQYSSAPARWPNRRASRRCCRLQA